MRITGSFIVVSFLVFIGMAFGADPWRVLSGDVGSQFGWSVAFVGDLNKDQRPELAVGVRNSGPDSDGEVVVYDGATWAPLFTIPAVNLNTGEFVGSAGDFDRDGVPDILVGAPGMGNATNGRGSLAIISGSDQSELFRADAILTAGYFGRAAAVIDDLDGDGFPEVVIGEPGGSRIYVCSGADGSFIANREVRGPAGASLGQHVAVIGDVDGDGKLDYAASGGGAAGIVMVISGASGAEIFSHEGTFPGDRLGEGLCAAGDQNGDGVPDVAVAAMGSGGRIEVYDGKNGKRIGVIARPDETRTMGHYLANAGRIDSDDRDDFICGAQAFVGVFSLSGKTGKMIEEFAGGEFDYPIFADGNVDVNGDQVPDFAVGGWGANRVTIYTPTRPADLPDVSEKLGAPFVRRGDAIGSKARGKMSYKLKGGKLTMNFAFSKLPASGTHTMEIERSVGTGMFQTVATIAVASGKAKYKLIGEGALPPELGVKDFRLLAGRRVVLRNAARKEVLSMIFPASGPPVNVSRTAVMETPTGSAYPDAKITVKFKRSGKKGTTKLSVKAKGLPKGQTFTLMGSTSPGSTAMRPMGKIVNGKLKLNSGAGDTLTGDAEFPVDIDRVMVSVVDDDTGEEVARAEPAYGPPEVRSDLKVTDIEIHTDGTWIQVSVALLNIGSVDVPATDEVRLSVTVENLSADTVETQEFLTGLSYPMDVERTGIMSPYFASGSEFERIRVRVAVDPVANPIFMGDIREEREDNNVRRTIFDYGGWDEDWFGWLPSFEYDTGCTTISDFQRTSGDDPKMPDLDVVRIQLDESGGVITASAMFQNVGSQSTAGAKDVRCTISDLDTGEERTGTHDADAGDFGEPPSRRDIYTVSGFRRDRLRVLMEFDHSDALDEELESNNVRWADFEWTGTEYDRVATGYGTPPE